MLEYETYRDEARTLSDVLAHSNPTETTLGGGSPLQFFGIMVSCNYFDLLAQPPMLGRALTAEDCSLGSPPVVVLGHELWTNRFDADPAIVGRNIELNRRLFTVVGVAAEDTYGGSYLKPGYFAPLGAEPLLSRTSRYADDGFHWLTLLGRRDPGASLEQARAELDVIASRLDRQDPGRATRVRVERATPSAIPPGARLGATGAAAVLMGAFALILLIACANVANLLLARGTARSQELGIRVSLGASRARMVRQLLTESLLISVTGGIVGCAVAFQIFPLAAAVLPMLLPPEIPALALDVDLSPDYRVMSFAMLLTVATGALFGLAPALSVSKPDLHSVVKQGSAGSGGHRRGRRLRGTLVGVQVALSMTLMIAAGLLLRGMQAAYMVDPGFAYDNVSYVTFGLNGLSYEADEAALFRERLRAEVAALPGVDAVAYGADPPLGEEISGGNIRLLGEAETEARFAETNGVGPGYFSLVGIPIVRGRTFTEAEVSSPARDGDLRPVIVTESTARNLWPEADPLGRTLLLRDDRLQVVGIARDAQVSTLGSIPPYYLYLPGSGKLLVKSRAEFASVAAGIYSIVRSIDPSLAVTVLPLEANIGWQRGLAAGIAIFGAALGGLALVLAAVGIYGVVAYSVARRFREIGIRMALGAQVRDVLATVLRQTMRPVAIGAVVGIAAVLLVSRVLAGVLFGASPLDPIGIGGSGLFVLGVAAAAGVLAARPAMRADPTVALRDE